METKQITGKLIMYGKKFIENSNDKLVTDSVIRFLILAVILVFH